MNLNIFITMKHIIEVWSAFQTATHGWTSLSKTSGVSGQN